MIKRYPHTRHWPSSLSVHRDDHYHQNPDFFVGKSIIITEKLDGGNVKIQNNQVYARSISSVANQSWFDYLKSRTLPKLYGVDSDICICGEDLYATHSICYDELPDSFFVFNIIENDLFWHSDDVLKFSQQYELQHVPILFEGVFHKPDEVTNWFMKHITYPSKFGPQTEGFVMRTVEKFLYDDFETNVCKFVRKNHVQTDERWEVNWHKANIKKL
jgi:hypothetical protein